MAYGNLCVLVCRKHKTLHTMFFVLLLVSLKNPGLPQDVGVLKRYYQNRLCGLLGGRLGTEYYTLHTSRTKAWISTFYVPNFFPSL